MKVIIVDDEIRVGNLIKNLIDWERLGLQLLGVFQSGYDVLEKFAVEPADILLCDIEMPDMSGLELVSRIFREYPATKCVIISGFRNFEYARQAMQYGVDHYLLKPVDEEELNNTLQLLCQNTEGSPDVKERENLLKLVSEGNFQPGSIEEVNRNYGSKYASGTFHLLRIVCDSARMLEVIMASLMGKLPLICNDYDSYGDRRRNCALLVNLNDSASLPDLVGLLYESLASGEGTLNHGAHIFVSEPFRSLDALADQWKETYRALWQRLFLPKNGIHYLNSTGEKPEPLKLTDSENNRLMKAVEDLNRDGLTQLIGEIFNNRLSQLQRFPYQVVTLTELVGMSTFNKLYNLGVRSEDFALIRQKVDEKLEEATSLPQLVEEISDLLYQDISSKLTIHTDQDNDYIRQAKNYILKNYNRSISLESLAEELNLNQTYVSALFKEGAGIKFKQYLTDVRIDNAKRLLRETNMNVSQIAYEVGYKNAFYFTSTFSAHEGIKPQEYRKIHRSR